MKRKTTSDFLCALGAALVDRRAHLRYPCPHRPPVELAVCPRFHSNWVEVHDISYDGIGFLCPEAIHKGTPVLFRLEPHRKGTRAEVVHVTRVLNGDGWHIGCAFAEPLMAEELVAYLPPPVNVCCSTTVESGWRNRKFTCIPLDTRA